MPREYATKYRVSDRWEGCRGLQGYVQRTDVPSLGKEYSEEEEDEERKGADPSRSCKRCGLVEIRLKHLERC